MAPPVPSLPLAQPENLPLAAPGRAPTERADAARNRQKILAAAAALVAERGIEHVSMHDVAEAASVGTGTLYRRFGDRAGLALALLDEDDRAFQDEMLSGPPPLGPGAPAAERLRAFVSRYLEFLDEHAEIMTVGASLAPAVGGPFELYATHLAILLREAAPHLDAEATAQMLINGFNPTRHADLRREAGWTLERMQAAWTGLVDALCRPPQST